MTVEWLEKGETKGKEIDVKSLFVVNPQLQRDVMAAANGDAATAKRQPAAKTNGMD